jgi:hypothetical protein
MKRFLVISSLAAMALTAATVRPASADECRDGRYVAPVVVQRFDADRDCNRSFAKQYNREYRRVNDHNDLWDRNDHNRDRSDHREGRDRR